MRQAFGTGVGGSGFFTLDLALALISLVILLSSAVKALSLDSALIQRSPRLARLLLGPRAR